MTSFRAFKHVWLTAFTGGLPGNYMWNLTNLIDHAHDIVGEISTIPDHVGNPAIAALHGDKRLQREQ